MSEQSMMFGEPIWVVVTVEQNPHSTIQAGWGGFGSVPFGGGGGQVREYQNATHLPAT